MTPVPQNPPNPPARIWALIPCAGSGSRAGNGRPKQYQPVAGLALVAHTLRAFDALPRVNRTLVVVSPDDSYFDENIGQKYSKNTSLLLANCGGFTRANSVFNGLNALLKRNAQENDWVLVHDAARCLVTPAQINALIDACQDDEVGGLLALKLPDTLKRETDGRVAGTIDRSDKWLAQTPQMFRIGPLLKALAKAFETGGDTVTDESSAMEASGFQPKLVNGSAQNFKVTYPEDFALAESVLLSRQPRSTAEPT